MDGNRVVLIGGVDPGTAAMGAAIVSLDLASGRVGFDAEAGCGAWVIKQPRGWTLERRLSAMACELADVLDAPRLMRSGAPLAAVGFERPRMQAAYRGKRLAADTAMVIGAALGASVAAVAMRAAGLAEDVRPAPHFLGLVEAKRTVAYSANAGKEAVAAGVMRMLGISAAKGEVEIQSDATDAMAVAVTTALQFIAAGSDFSRAWKKANRAKRGAA
jgi:Holliday junction resolvasome RuvABC endonuclease subunit